MKTILTEKIDGRVIVIGFSKAIIDAVETQKKIRQEIKKKESYKELKVLGAKHLRLPKGKNQNKEEMRLLKKEIKSKTIQFNKDLIELFAENKVYFNVRPNEFVVDKDVYKKAMKEYKKAVRDGKKLEFSEGEFFQIVDNRNQEYHIRENGIIVKKKIEKIGTEFPDGIIKELSFKDRNEMIDGELKKSEVDFALREATVKRSEFEILGDSKEEALSKSQKWHADKLKEIEAKYA